MKQSRPYPVYTITPKGERAILSGHPWVYAEELTDQPDPAPANGALVDVVSAKGRYLGTGQKRLLMLPPLRKVPAYQ